MDTGEGSVGSFLVNDLKQQEWALGQETVGLPANAEAYLALPLAERMSTAKDVVEAYADLTPDRVKVLGHKPAIGEVECDQEGFSIESRVRFIDATWNSRQKRVMSHKPARLFVEARAVDVENDVKAGFQELGQIVFPEDAQPHAQDPYDAPIKYSLDSERAGEIVEAVDAAVVALLEGVVAKNRKFLGETAIGPTERVRVTF